MIVHMIINHFQNPLHVDTEKMTKHPKLKLTLLSIHLPSQEIQQEH